ncbi:MAG: hypothetical protein HKN72_06830 [Gemmatimonadetes bacterium]|nr:hypothetical protein [Gemmatimonadota bacterium]
MSAFALAVLSACGPDEPVGPGQVGDDGGELDARLSTLLAAHRLDGRIEEQLEVKLGRSVDERLAEVGRLLFFDRVLSLTEDNSCAGCHGPNVSFNDAVSISIGVDNNLIVGENRQGPHNLRRAPSVVNAAFFPRLMWDGRFEALSLDPFDNSDGFVFPPPEGTSLSRLDHLLAGQAFTPVVSRIEMAGFDFVGDAGDIRSEIATRVDAIPEYRERFAEVYPAIDAGDPIDYDRIAAALAEFQFTLVRADAPVDWYARGDTSALTASQKRGGILFFGFRAACFECHITEGYANQMFSDFKSHNLAVPQIRPVTTNADFDGPGDNEDFGFEHVSGDPGDRYKFRTQPLRNVAYQPQFMHNGAYVCLEDAVRHHTDVFTSLDNYSNTILPTSLRGPMGPVQPMLDRVHGLSAVPRELTDDDIDDLVAFMHALSDPDAHPDRLASLIPAEVPSGLPLQDFDFNSSSPSCN